MITIASLRAASRRAATLVLCLALPVGMTACAGLPTQSFIAPGAHDARYDGFLAYGAFSDLAVEGAYEKAMCRQLLAAGHACETMLDAASPTAPQNGASRRRAAVGSGAQAVVMIELLDPDADSRRILASGRPGYRVSLIDIKSQKVVARFAIEGRKSHEGPAARAKRVARAVTHALQQRHLLKQRS